MTRFCFATGVAVLTCCLLAACASLPSNPPLDKYAPDAGYRFERLERGDNNSDELFVIVAFSGGGTRAAALAYGVLEALRDTTIEWRGRRVSLLDEVDVISSVSGGSFPAAYYALRGRQVFDEFPDRFLYRPIQDDLLKLMLWPGNWLRLASPSFGRSDLAAEFYDREVFGGATYADLIVRNRRPYVILNATDMTAGVPFTFVQDQFDLMCSDLAGVSLGRAVASSSAFPVLLTPLTFQSYAGPCGYRQPAWVQLAADDRISRVNPRRVARAENLLSFTTEGPERRSYIHLTDGGVADNIGLREPITAISSINHHWSVLRMMNQVKLDSLIMIVVNANNNPATERDKSSHVPGIIDTVMRSAVVPLDNYSVDTVELMSLLVGRAIIAEFNRSADMVEAECMRRAARKEPCTLSAPRKIGFFPIEVAFDYVESNEERIRLKNLPTSFQLPRETVDWLRDVGRRLLRDDPGFKRLLKVMNGCLAGNGQTC
jgi:NTE family protein